MRFGQLYATVTVDGKDYVYPVPVAGAGATTVTASLNGFAAIYPDYPIEVSTVGYEGNTITQQLPVSALSVPDVLYYRVKGQGFAKVNGVPFAAFRKALKVVGDELDRLDPVTRSLCGSFNGSLGDMVKRIVTLRRKVRVLSGTPKDTFTKLRGFFNLIDHLRHALRDLNTYCFQVRRDYPVLWKNPAFGVITDYLEDCRGELEFHRVLFSDLWENKNVILQKWREARRKAHKDFFRFIRIAFQDPKYGETLDKIRRLELQARSNKSRANAIRLQISELYKGLATDLNLENRYGIRQSQLKLSFNPYASSNLGDLLFIANDPSTAFYRYVRRFKHLSAMFHHEGNTGNYIAKYNL